MSRILITLTIIVIGLVLRETAYGTYNHRPPVNIHSLILSITPTIDPSVTPTPSELTPTVTVTPTPVITTVEIPTKTPEHPTATPQPEVTNHIPTGGGDPSQGIPK